MGSAPREALEGAGAGTGQRGACVSHVLIRNYTSMGSCTCSC